MSRAVTGCEKEKKANELGNILSVRTFDLIVDLLDLCSLEA